jgi:hypothetical protein
VMNKKAKNIKEKIMMTKYGGREEEEEWKK